MENGSEDGPVEGAILPGVVVVAGSGDSNKITSPWEHGDTIDLEGGETATAWGDDVEGPATVRNLDEGDDVEEPATAWNLGEGDDVEGPATARNLGEGDKVEEPAMARTLSDDIGTLIGGLLCKMRSVVGEGFTVFTELASLRTELRCKGDFEISPTG